MIKIILLSLATFYASSFNGKQTASGATFSQNKFTCATCDYKLGSSLKVSYKSKSVIVIVNDRCKKSGIIDLTKAAFTELAPLERGAIIVKIKIINNLKYK